ncbi:T9SS type A sorting domain-containing protein [Winogradskyella thalassocola]|uniref:Por secretion system C-terminal sorting domain-containing protein n=1 Tax=Winogradskyella thalassocola TaxID=262004 RepID=A0A1G8DPI9_9FLAO|nr:T9SS type A sorting domain-containing protein [Winogradskyella thalassocola]SDH59643.1 Por secretion system C-terminal sorting domain-containing protein [Winogradskyella thalassocola]
MKNFKPTLIFLSAICFYNLSEAQQFETGIDDQNQLQDDYIADDQNYLNGIPNETEFDYNIEPSMSSESVLDHKLEDEHLERSTFDDSVTYVYDDGWVSTDPVLNGLDASDLIVVQSGELTFSSSITLSLITVEGAASIIIESGVVVTANIILNSVAGGYSSLISDGTITGVVTYNRNTSMLGENELVSPPLTGQLYSVFSSANLNLGTHPSIPTIKAYAPFVTATSLYNNLDTQGDGSHVLAAGNGYRAATTDGGDLTYVGTVETSDIDDLVITDAGDGNTWNLIGNPYPSYLDLNTFYAANIDELNPESKGLYCYTGDFFNPWEILNQATLELSANTVLLAPGQGFFVKAKTGGGLIDFTTEMRAVIIPVGEYSRGTSDAVSAHHGYIKLKLSSASSNYYTDFFFNSNASEGLDPGYDASIFESVPPAFSIYSSLIEGNEDLVLAIQALNNVSMDDAIISLGVNANQGQELTFSIAESDMSDLTNIYLEDIVNNTVTLLNTTDYIFTPSTDLSGTGRFYLRFENTTLSTINVEAESVKIYVDNTAKTININGQLQSNTTAKLFDVNGRLVLTNVLNTNNTNQSINVSQLSSGVYIVELDNNTNERRIEKLIIR